MNHTFHLIYKVISMIVISTSKRINYFLLFLRLEKGNDPSKDLKSKNAEKENRNISEGDQKWW